MAHNTVEHMKWWGWGREGVAFTHDDKPALRPFIQKVIDVDLDEPGTDIPDLDALDVPASSVPSGLHGELDDAVGEENVHTDKLDRVVHTYGKSLRDLVRIRQGDLGRVPDVVVYPGTEPEVQAVLRAALGADAVVVPFGGGSNIAGSLEAPRGEKRTVVSVDMGRLNQVLAVDEESRLAKIQAGVLGPYLEQQLNEMGWTLGHFPDSFSHSSLGGWIATRSSGMQSDKYGDIGDMVKGVHVVTPTGLLQTRPVPSTSTGPSLNQIVLGSEGRLGIITEAVLQVHRLPAKRTILGYFFPDWHSGLAAMRDIARSEVEATVTRVSDANETAFSMATSKAGGSKLSELGKTAVKRYLGSVKRYDLDQLCLSFIGYEGSPAHVQQQRQAVGRIVSHHGGVCVGTGPGELYDQKKFDTPYIRDFLLDRGAMGDVSETATSWARLPGLYDAATAAARAAFDDLGVTGFVMCHLSHSYHSGACLYFTFAFRPGEGADPLKQYDQVKHAIQQAFMDNGATLSHHHAVGVEHAEWLAEDVSEPGVAVLRGLFAGTDPNRNLNPGAIIGD